MPEFDVVFEPDLYLEWLFEDEQGPYTIELELEEDEE